MVFPARLSPASMTSSPSCKVREMMRSTSQPYNDIVKTMEHKISKVLFSFMLLSAAMVAEGGQKEQKVYRWVDENGEVHYTQSLPPDFQDKKHDVLDERGIVREADMSLVPTPPPPKIKKEDDPMELPRDSSGMERPKALYSEKEMKEKMDRFLML
jgi:hypothetical protein